jgi:predicted DNA-binding transcriptional regulator AlpA
MKMNELSISQLVKDVRVANSTKEAAPISEWRKASGEESVNVRQLIRINELSQLTTLSKSCINLWVAQGKFPAPLTLSATIKVWFLQEILDWLESQRETK